MIFGTFKRKHGAGGRFTSAGEERQVLGGSQEGRWRRRQSRQCRRGVQVFGLVANTAARWPPGGKVAQDAESPVQRSAGARISC